jgi:RNA polymerase sigma-70 factor (ECF subfamily)
LEKPGILAHPNLVVDGDVERDWIRRVKEGDPQAYRPLVERYESRIYRLVARLLGPGHGDIEDVVQEVFVKAYYSLSRFRQDSSFGTWVTRIAVNKARDELRKRSGRISFEEEGSHESDQVLRDYFCHADSDEESVSHPSEALSCLVGRAVAGLPKSRHARARAKLREGLSPDFPERGRR